MSQSITITAEDILKQVKLSLTTAELIEAIITHKMIANTAEELGIKIEAEELQEMADKYRKMYKLLSEEDTWAWMKKNHLSLDDFEEFVYCKGLASKLAVHLFADKIEPYFYEHQLDYAGVVMYEVVLEDEDLAMELFYSIQEGEMSFYDVAHKYIEDKELRRKGGYRGILYRKDLKPEISAAVFAATSPGVLKPIVTSKGVHLILVEEIIERKLDNWLRNKIATDLFDDWVSNSLINFKANKNIEICN
ncbi:MAG: peptidylprolyl isomerase [Limnospira sp. PMC 1291.21]|uniref:peptidylprolyl isomerase n=1 Tax=unclassified Limnospira TaxID=2642885 RepID=UPI0028E109D4|nr:MULTISPECIES: peptidylprolyl isomerase [unclassified Limnospira]MDT9178933.1 peptidylprolyl isomerase [Limnospira sp. PMC 1238.20]MDT9194153.1 peptidylprolyl isomerase [Limnospira sp. PMC 1245.20]MDT9204395.1 peptidylprolyl isomerase [Limnospira sp. PMC 1243.20]MDT9224992.1 peptidylprolyl isomerase [Limnospira sp. PMC 1279.21]MDT9230058.1 peptidylprolyl isomerase [Limnospira sp. PMC 1242.20]